MTRIKRYVIDSPNGIRVSYPGYDVDTADPAHLSLSPTSRIPQIVMQGVYGGPFPGDVFHNLGFAPIVLPNIVRPGNPNATPGFGSITPFSGYQRPSTIVAPVYNSQIVSLTDRFTFLQSPVGNLAVNYFAYSEPAI